MNKRYSFKTINSISSFKKVCIVFVWLILLGSKQANAQWSSLGAGSCDIVYSSSPDVTNTGIYFGMNFGNACPTTTKNFLQHWNGAAVVALNASCYVNGYIYAIAVSGNNIYIGGSFTTANGAGAYGGIACWNTVTNTWSTLGTGAAGSGKTIYALTIDPVTNTLYAGGEYTSISGTGANNVAAYNIGAGTWLALAGGVTIVPAGSPPGAVAGAYALTYCANKLYVGGRFVNANGAAANSIAAWDGAAWSTLTGGGQIGVSNTTVVNPANVASAVWDAPVMALTNDGKTVYVGGDFNKVNNATGCNNIAAWNSTTLTWSTLGAGMTWPGDGTTPTDNTFGDQANVYALTMYAGNVIAGGDFMKAGTVGGANTSLFVAQWNGTAWSALSGTCGGVTESDVFCLTVSDGILYAGGQFPSDPPNTPANMWYIAEYTGAGPNISISVAPTNTICAGGSTIITASSGASSYSWLPTTGLSCTGCAAPTASPTVTTTYTVTGTLGGCSSTKTITVVVTPKPTILLTPTSSTLCGSSSSTTITASGASTYTWSNAATLSASIGTIVTATPTTTTIYTVNATDGNGCTNNNTIAITVSPLPTLTVTVSSATICVGSTTTLTATGASTYTWSPAGSLSSSTGSTVSATPTVTTNYTVNATSAGGCTNTQTVTINVNPLPTLTLTASSSTVCAGTTSTLTAAGAITYTWSPAGSLSSSTGTPVVATPTTTITYTVNATDNNGCKNNKTITVNTNPLPILTLTASATTVCTGNSSTLTATGATTYTWSPAGSLSSPTGSPVTATPTATTTYTVNATNANGCTNNSSITVNVTPTPSLSILPSSAYTICLGDSATMMVTGATTYSWSPSASLNSSTSATVIATPTTTTIYNVSGTLAGCGSAATTATVTVNLPPDINAHGIPSSICMGGSSTLTAVGTAISYTWSPTGSLSSPTGTMVVASPTVTTDYTVTGTGANGCTAKDSVKITVNPTPTISIVSGGGGGSQTVCAGTIVNAITFTSSIGTTVNWGNTNTNIGIAATGTNTIASYIAPIVSTQQTGTITAIATSTITGCKSDTTNPPVYVVTVNPLPVINATDSLTPGGCGGLANGCISNVAGQAPGTYQYSWNNGTTWSSNSQNCNIPAGNYVVEVQDANGCISQKSISLPTANAPANHSVTGNPVNTCAGDTIHLSVTAPQLHMTYTWTTASGTQTGTTYTINNVNPAGTYTVGLAVSDTNACSNDTSFSFTVNAPPHPVITGNNHFCKGTSTVLNVTPTGANFSYQWDLAGVSIGGATASTYTATSGGTFGVAVTNTLTGCMHDTTIVITVDSVPAAPSITTTTTNNTYCQGAAINPIIVTGTGTFIWYSDPGLTTPIGTGSPFTPSVTATSTLYVTASNSVCTSDSTPVSITINPTPPTPTITVGAGNTAYCQSTSVGTIVATGPSTIVWYNNATLTHVIDTGNTYTPTGLPLGTTIFYLIDSSAAGCKSVGTTTASVTINQNPATPTVITPTANVYCQNVSPATIIASGASTIMWYDNASLTNVVDTGTTYTPTGLPVGTTTYYLVDSSAASCKSTGTATVSVTINQTPTTPTLTTSNSVTDCQESPMSMINATGSGTLVWYNNAALTPPSVNTGNSYTPTNLSVGPHTYYITDTSAAGCKSSATTSVTVTVYPKPTITGLASIDSSTCSKNNGSVSGLMAGSGTAPYTYEWVNSSGAVVGNSQNLTGVGAGTYSLIIIDSHLCRDTSSGTGFVVGGSNAPTASFVPSTTEGQAPLAVTFSNTSVGATNYNWNFGINTGTSTQTNPAYTYTATGTYTVILVAIKGNCSDTATQTITVDVTDVLIIPNIFSPNGDAINDEFFITSSGINMLNCDIYNRWGELLYTLKAPNQAWDGRTPNGGSAPDGTYFYILQATSIDGKEYKRNGPLTLVR
jgi:gliding motility-associated-like protein